MSKQFVHTHVHTEYSMLDGHSRVRNLVKRASEFNMPALAMTDHGAMYGAIEFYKACREKGVNPIVGVEAYLAPDMHDKSGKFDYHHMLLMAQNYTGYQNLLKLVTLSHTQGFYYRPRIDMTLLAQHSDGLIATSGCLAGEIPQLFLQDKDDEAVTVADRFLQVFGRDRYFIELQDHLAGGDQAKVNPKLLALAKRQNLKLLATNDLHYVDQEDAKAQDAMLCVQMGKALNDPARMRFDGPEYYLKGPDEMRRLFSYAPQSCDNTLLVAEMCNLEIPFNRKLIPDFPPPPGFATDAAYLRYLCEQGLVERYGTVTDAMLARLEREFNVIATKGFIPYFLIVHDYVNYARQQGMRCVARGSVAGSIIAYALGISNVDPLAYKIPFERFLNPERKAMPDIDIDFPDDRREEVVRYVAEKYGWHNVGQISTFAVMGGKYAVRDIGRILGEQETADRIARMLKNGEHIFEKNEKDETVFSNAEVAELYKTDRAAQTIINLAKDIDGSVRSVGTHAAGVIISREPLDTIVPCQLRDHKDPHSGLQVQYEQGYAEELGLLKMDFLGLSNLTILQDIVRFIRETTGEIVDLDRIPRDDAETFDIFAKGFTTGVFQMEGPQMTRFLMELKPTDVRDIMAMVALYRPGPMESIGRYIKAKHGLIEPSYPHPALESILRESYGVIVYQDQVLEMARLLAGFSWGEVDAFRKGIGKKIAKVIAEQKDKFIAGCVKNGISQTKATELFAFISPFANYGFNKAHACAYGWVAYQTAYLKAHYPSQFMAATLTKEAGDATKVARILAECKRMGVEVRGPNINRSLAGFTLEREGDTGKYSVRFGLTGIKGVGPKQADAIIAEREARGAYRNLADIFARAEGRAVSSGVVSALVKAGACDSFGERGALFDSLDDAKKVGKKYRGAPDTTLFGEQHPILAFAPHETTPATQATKLAWEKELMNVYVSGNPLYDVADKLESVGMPASTIDIETMANTKITVAGTLAMLRAMRTKTGDDMVSGQLEDLSGTLDFVVFPAVYQKTSFVWAQSNIVVLTGTLKARDGHGAQLVVGEAYLFNGAAKPSHIAKQASTHVLEVTFESQGGVADLKLLKRLGEIFAEHPGREDYAVYRVKDGQRTRMAAANGKGVVWGEALQQQLSSVGVGVERKEVAPVNS